MGYKKLLILISLLVACVFLIRCINHTSEKPAVTEDRFQKFAGSQVCASCHKDIYEKHLHTEHHRTSAPATAANILGSFNEKNTFAFDASTQVKMEKRDSGFYQVEYADGREIKKEKFDIVVGSGRKGQSYLAWINNKLVQLPITYFTYASQWSNSPGYPPHKVAFSRPITSRCLECHSTYFEKLQDSSKKQETFDRNKIIFGVECEKCHGPALQHVAFHQNHISKEAKFILNPGKFSRERLLDFCSLCHGGALAKTKPSFSFQAGDTLANYFSLQMAMLNADNIDVHGNQAGLLYLSKCFTSSNITCLNCHNTHQNEDGQLQTFSQRCLSCHQQPDGKQCKLTATIGPSITQNCIDCHMPKQPSKAVAVYLQGNDVPTSALMRTHYIKIYPDETKKFLEQHKHKK